MKSYRVTDTITGKTVACATLRNARKRVARVLAGDIDGNMATIEGPNGYREIAKARSLAIDYTVVAA